MTIEYREDHFTWNPARRRFLLLEPDPQTLVEVVIERTDVQAQRVHEGWHLISTVDHEVNAQPHLVDLWTRVTRDHEDMTEPDRAGESPP